MCWKEKLTLAAFWNYNCVWASERSGKVTIWTCENGAIENKIGRPEDGLACANIGAVLEWSRIVFGKSAL